MATDQKYNDKTSKELKRAHAFKQPVDKRGLPISASKVPGLNRPTGTPGWLSGPAKSAAKKAK